MFRLIRVRGDSMSPTLQDGDILLTKKTKPRSIRPGFIYVINHGDLGQIVKRLGEPVSGRYPLMGDNPKSTSPDLMGTVTADRITRRALWAITPKGIKRL